MIFCTKKKKVELPVIRIDGEVVEIVDHFNYLGIILDRHLSWNEHITSVATKISKTIGVLNRLKHFLPPYILKLIYNSLIGSKIKYGLLSWGSCSERIFKLQKKAVRVITNSKYNSHTDALFKKLYILKIQDDKKVQEICFYYKFCHNLLPKYFSENFVKRMNSRRNSQQLIFPRFRHEYARKMLRYSLVKTINESPPHYISKVFTHSLKGLLLYLKNGIISEYQSVCLIANCYICSCNGGS